MMPYRPDADGLMLAVRLTPRASRNGLDRTRADAEGRPVLQMRLVAPPVDGAANAALVAYLSAALGLRKADIVIRSGERSRSKTLLLRGDPDVLAARIDAWLQANLSENRIAPARTPRGTRHG